MDDLPEKKYKNVSRWVNRGKQVWYHGTIKHKGDVFSKAFKTPLESAKWVDKKCLVLGIPQKNNLFKKA